MTAGARRQLVLLAVAAAPLACRQSVQTAANPAQPAAAVMRSAAGVSHGTLRLERTGTGVRIAGTLTGLPAGPHGIHFHQVGRCEAPGFTSAGPHLNPVGALHGLENPLGPHSGDLPNVTVGADGRAVVDLVSTRVTLDDTGPADLLAGDGTALVIHANADDQRTDPSGNSGDRIACGVVARGTGSS
jgi:Cu-Zn family superoxide dismutase